MNRTIRGRVHGKTIQLDEDPGVPEGEEVEIQVTIIRRKKQLPGPPPGWQPGGGKSTAGLLMDLGTEEEDRLLREIHEDRRREARREIAE